MLVVLMYQQFNSFWSNVLKGVSMEDLSTGTLYVANNLTVDGRINASGLSIEDISLGTVDVSNNLTVAGTSTLTLTQLLWQQS